MSEPLIAGVELGGTKAIGVLGRGGTIVERVSVPTTTPAEVFAMLRAKFDRWPRAAALGIASFGPIRLDPDAVDYGTMLATAKPNWPGAQVIAGLTAITDGPTALHTDVGAAALAEAACGAGAGLRDLAYVTIGTGIGVGVIAGGALVTGQLHPEAGHVRVRRLTGDGFAGVCPFHGDCLEGLASGPAIAARVGMPATTLQPDDPAWDYVADALAEGFAMLFATLSTRRIVVGGGVAMGQGAHLLPRVRELVVAKLGHYLDGVSDATIATMIVPAALGGDAGPIGALLLGERALAAARRTAAAI